MIRYCSANPSPNHKPELVFIEDLYQVSNSYGLNPAGISINIKCTFKVSFDFVKILINLSLSSLESELINLSNPILLGFLVGIWLLICGVLNFLNRY